MTEVTTVVMTRDRWPDLATTLPRHQAPVIVVDNASSDGTPVRVRHHFPDIQVVRLPRNAGAVARNLGVLAARTPYVAFADDDSWWEPGALDSAARLLDAHPRLGLVAARMLVGPDRHLEPTCVEMAQSPLRPSDDLPGVPVLGFIACGAVVRRTAFLDAAGFDPVVFFAGEEERLALDLASAGWGLAYVDSITALHQPSPARDPGARLVRVARNRLLTAVMRRPWPAVADVVRSLLRDPAGRAGVVRALPRLPSAMLRRRVLPAGLEAQRRLLD